MLMVGPPGSGKSMLASCLPGILPPLDATEALEVSMIHSVAGLLQGGRLLRNRQFREPHQGTSLPALVGGSSKAKPGEFRIPQKYISSIMQKQFHDLVAKLRKSQLEGRFPGIGDDC